MPRAVGRWFPNQRCVGFVNTEVIQRGQSLDLLTEQIERGRPIGASTLEAINALLARPIAHGEFVRARHGFLRRFRFEVRAPVDLLVPVAETASDFLFSPAGITAPDGGGS